MSGVRFLACFFFQAEDGIRDLVRSRGLGDVYKRQTTRIMFFTLDCQSVLRSRFGLLERQQTERVEYNLSLIHI